jgi:hypothetical protein
MALGAAAQAGYEIVVADSVAGEQFAVTVEIDDLGKDAGECVGTLRHSCPMKHSEHFFSGYLHHPGLLGRLAGGVCGSSPPAAVRDRSWNGSWENW